MAQIGWIQFSTRADIKDLPLHEQKKKFLLENNSRLQEDLHILNRIHGASATSGGGSGGVVIDGPIADAIVSSNAGIASTDAGGNFVLPGKASGTITVTGGTDAITGLPYEGELIGDAQYKTISPITTFAHYLKEASIENEKTPTLTIEQAIEKTFTDSFDYFGISLPVEDKDIILQNDYIGDSILNNNKIGISAQAVATQIEAIAETIGVALGGSKQATAATKAGKEIPEFSEEFRKRTAYRALCVQVERNNRIDVNATLSDVKFTNPFNGQEVIGVGFENSKVLNNQLDQTKQELISLASQEQYTNNYLTTRIQAVNRAQKTVIKDEIKTTVETPKAEFSDIRTVSNSDEVKDALNQIEKGKANEKTPQLDGSEFSIPLKEAKFKQLRKDSKTGTSSFLELTIDTGEVEDFYYFGNAKDMPSLLGKNGDKYSRITVTGTLNQEADEAVVPDTPLFIEITSSTVAEDVVKTYTLQPTVATQTGLGGKLLVSLRLTKFTEEITKKVIDHIVDSSVGYYTAIYTRDSDKDNPLTYDRMGVEEEDSNVLTMAQGRIGGGALLPFELGRYEGASPSTLLELRSVQRGVEPPNVSLKDLVFKDNKLSLSIPEVAGEKFNFEKGILDITFIVGSNPDAES